ncbi:hypothetical protein L9F63_023547 [Diploptera punctata]|uniref:Uncharacterized protein n=1 Tax=Diploptera punctata TaxID=6984 RepID=A0AAD8E8K6_DIPPU|nr:hypothetical protein L9F63_023547 [Diploptera punctata]
MTFPQNNQTVLNYLVNLRLSPDDLRNLICEFQPEINSKRRSSYITSTEELIRILEKRGFLKSSFENFASRFAGRVSVPVDREMMTRYVPIAQGQRGYIGSNNFAGSGLPPYSRQPSYGSVGSRNTDTETIQDPYGILPEAAINRIVRDIGTNWKDLARGLDIPEGI